MAEQPAAPAPAAAPGQPKPLTPNDFEFGKCLGEGSFARVFHARRKDTKEQFAIKVLKKKQFLKENKVKYVKMEKNILAMLNHPNIIRLTSTFQDPQYLYFVLEFAPNGELFRHIRRAGACDRVCAAFYAAEIINALDCMKGYNVVHRDMKPENILLSADWHVKISDFGTAKIVEQDGAQAHTFCGTAEYVSPEVLKDKAASYSSDLWALGCIIFQLLAGRPPFKADNEYLTFQKILHLEYHFPDTFPSDAKDLVKRLLILEPSRRLGAGPGGYDELRKHAFFHGLDFETLHKQTPPPIVSAKGDQQPTAPMASLNINEPESPATSSEPPTPKVKHPEQDTWAQLLLANENIVHCGLVSKKRHMSNKKRKLILTDFPRLFYVDPDSREQKGEILWSDALRPELKDNSNFIVHTPARDFIFEDAQGTAGQFVEAISKMLKQQAGAQTELKSRFLYEHEVITHSSTVFDKTKKMRKRKRLLVLTDLPRLICVNDLSLEHKFDISCTDQLTVEKKDNANFTIYESPALAYSFEETNCEAGKWFDLLKGLKANLELQTAEVRSKILDQGEGVLHQSWVIKAPQSGAPNASTKCLLILTDLPRLLAVATKSSDGGGDEVECTEWAEKITGDAQNERNFALRTTSKSYEYIDVCGGSAKWVEMVAKHMQNFGVSKERGESVFTFSKSM